MSPLCITISLTFLYVVVLLSSTTTTAHNITRILNSYPAFSQFNQLLTQTKLAEEINRRGSITVLALTNDRIGDLASKPEFVLKRILSVNIILDYYDVLKLNKLQAERTTLTALYQATGLADDQQGFVDVVHKKDNTIVFGSSMKGSPLNVKVEGFVAKIPYNISVLSVSNLIIAPGIDGSYKTTPTQSPKPVATALPPAQEVTPPAESPYEDVSSPTDAPIADAPITDSPIADGPDADAPAPADAPTADDLTVAPPPRSAAGKQVVYGASIGFLVALVPFIAAH